MFSRSAPRAAWLLWSCWLGGCAAAPAPVLHTAQQVPAAIEVPPAPRIALLPRRVVARGLDNPRGMQLVAPNALLVSEAGTGVPDVLSGRLTRLEDDDGNGDFLGDAERRTLLDQQPSRNLLDIVRRDEVFGMAGMDAGEGHVLVALAFFGGPSTLFQVDGDVVTQWGRRTPTSTTWRSIPT